jgi:hypothetical protein
MCPSRGLGVTGAMSALGQASIGSNIPGLLGRAEGGGPLAEACSNGTLNRHFRIRSQRGDKGLDSATFPP